jgi:hypothetical protein
MVEIVFFISCPVDGSAGFFAPFFKGISENKEGGDPDDRNFSWFFEYGVLFQGGNDHWVTKTGGMSFPVNCSGNCKSIYRVSWSIYRKKVLPVPDGEKTTAHGPN